MMGVHPVSIIFWRDFGFQPAGSLFLTSCQELVCGNTCPPLSHYITSLLHQLLGFVFLFLYSLKLIFWRDFGFQLAGSLFSTSCQELVCGNTCPLSPITLHHCYTSYTRLDLYSTRCRGVNLPSIGSQNITIQQLHLCICVLQKLQRGQPSPIG